MAPTHPSDSPKFSSPFGIALAPLHTLYVADDSATDANATDHSAGPGETGAVFRIDPKSGKVRTVRSGPPIDETYGIDFDRKGKIFITENSDPEDNDDIQRMSASGKGLTAFPSPDFGAPQGVVAGG